MSVTKSGIVPQAETYTKEVSSQDQSLYKILKPGEFSAAPMSLYYGAVGKYRGHEEAIVSPAYITFCASGSVNSDFLDLVLRDRRIVQVYSALSQGANKEGKRRTTSFSDFCSIRRPMPRLSEQCAIASVLSEVCSAIEAVELLIKEVEHAKTAVMRELLTRGLAGEWARMVPLPERWVLGRVAEGVTHMPAGWQLVRYDEACLSIQVGIVVQPASLYADVGVPALRSLNVKENQVDRSNMVLISEKAHKANKKSELRAGNVVTVRTGVPGISAVVPDDLDGANCIDILISRIGKNAVPGFLTQFLNSSLAKRQIAVLQGGLAQQHLNVKELKGLKLLLPPLDEQIAIADAGEAFDRRIAAERAHLSELRATKDALAQELLSGRVRLPASMIARFETAPPHEAAAE
ncbi:restriction endonuclease subunit S [Azospirillum humicireducens]|nr:restriction endonuclease subunit S [Azospirillum humicireducens]